MMKQTKQIVVLLLILLIFTSCDNIVLSSAEKDYLNNISESESFDYLFEDDGLTVRIYDSKIVETYHIPDVSPVIAHVFFRKIVTKKRTINAKGKITLKYISDNKEVFVSEIAYSDIIVFEKLVNNFEKIINNYPSADINSLMANKNVKKQIDSIVKPDKIKEINIYKYEINTKKGLNHLYWMIDRVDKTDKIITIFDESNKLVNIIFIPPKSKLE